MRVKGEGSVHVLFYLEAFWSVLIINRKWWWWSSVPEAIEDDRGLKKVSREQGPEEGVRALNKATNHAGLDKSCHQWTSINHGGNYHSVWKWQPCIIMGKILLRGSIYPVNTTWYRPVVHNLKVWMCWVNRIGIRLQAKKDFKDWPRIKNLSGDIYRLRNDQIRVSYVFFKLKSLSLSVPIFSKNFIEH